VSLEPAATSARRARRFVAQTLREWGDDDLVEAAELLVSELVTNAVLHAGSAVEVTVDGRWPGHGVRIEVQDASVAEPRLGGFDLDSVSGRGLAMVDAISARWGVDQVRTGKRVWFELACQPVAAAS
jgi:anti-sigma regulatory factor (Ser/Thr protein kinase)